ncbi:MAG: hypothetical protein JRJ51_22895 [Deltaproteobacteria bacterium]|nr:hypothetical protein [Deltaproteobacteria bacterium]
MKKWILIGVCAVVVIVVAAVLVGLSNLGPIIKNAVNTYGPQITKTEVRVGDVGISIFSVEAKLKDFHLGNPKGFTSPEAMKVDSIYVNVDAWSITGDTIVIERIELVKPVIHYEKKRGTDNFKSILHNVQQSAGSEKKVKKESGREEGSRKIIIQNFIVKGGKVNLAMGGLGGKSFSASLPTIHLKDIGKEKGGASPAEAFNEIFAALYGRITSSGVTDLLSKGLKDMGVGVEGLSKGAGEQLGTSGDSAKKGMEGVTDKVKGLFGK